MSRRTVAIIGCGAIGSILAHAIDQGRAGDAELAFLFDLKRDRAEGLAKELQNPPKVTENLSEVLEDESVNLVIEAASQEAVIKYSLNILRAGKDLMVLSIGAFSDEDLLEEIRKFAKKVNRRIYLPSGAILGLDGIKAAKIANIDEATLTTRKPPETLADSKFVKEKKMNLSTLRNPEAIFEGTAREAVEAFPESVNIAASLSLAATGFDQTKVRIIADPSLNKNVHEVRIKGEAGEFTTKARNVPSPDNPKTSYLAALSAIRTLRDLTETVKIGT